MMDSKHYEIQVQGQLDEHWSSWFEGLALTHGPDGTTVLTGPVTDSAALFGLLDKVRDLGLALVSLHRLDTQEERSTDQA